MDQSWALSRELHRMRKEKLCDAKSSQLAALSMETSSVNRAFNWAFRSFHIFFNQVGDDTLRNNRNPLQFNIFRYLNGMTWISERRRNMGHFPFTNNSAKLVKHEKSPQRPELQHFAERRKKIRTPEIKADSGADESCVCEKTFNWRNFFRPRWQRKQSQCQALHHRPASTQTVCGASEICLIGWWLHLGQSQVLWHLRQGPPRQLRSGEPWQNRQTWKGRSSQIDNCLHCSLVNNYVRLSSHLLFAMLSACR